MTTESESSPILVPKKFGTFLGVFIPSILTVLGLIMYLRMGWVVGNLGVFGTIVVVTISSFITLVTGLSISATATNMTVKTGGAYYMISRSFGLEPGAAIGVPLFLAQAIGVSFYIAGFSESIQSIYPHFPIQAIGLVSLIGLATLAFYSPDLALKTQLLIFVVIIGSIVSLLLGKPLEVSEIPLVKLEKVGFWAVFAVFFPAVTGILSGVSMSGDLKDPGKSIPRGTIAAVLTGYIVYLLVPIALQNFAPESALISDTMLMTKVAAFAPIIFLGIWGATLSSALGSLLAAPRTLQALAADQVVPRFLGKGYGPSNDPRIATAITFVIAAVGIYMGSIDAIAPILTMFFLTSYGILNLTAGIETLLGNPSWRPSFKVPWILSIGGALGCFAVMMLIDAGPAFIAFLLCAFVYMVMKRRNVKVQWGDARRGLLIHLIRNQIYELAKYQETGRTWRPNLFVLSGAPTSRWYLIALADAISHGKGFLTVCSIVRSKNISKDKISSMEKSMHAFLEKRQVPALTKVKVSEDLLEGLGGIIDDYGLGAIKPNTFVLGDGENEKDLTDFAMLIQMLFRAKKNTLLVRNPDLVYCESPGNERKRNQRKIIDIWWGMNNANAHLMLTFSYLIQTSPEWMGAELRVRSLVDDEDERQGVLSNLKEFIAASRIQSAIDVLVKRPDAVPLDQIARYSADADLVFIGMRPPKEDETGDDYCMYYEDLMERTKKFPQTIITLAGEDLKFADIFKIDT